MVCCGPVRIRDGLHNHNVFDGIHHCIGIEFQNGRRCREEARGSEKVHHVSIHGVGDGIPLVGVCLCGRDADGGERMINYESMPEVLNLMVAIVMVMCVCMAITEVLKVYAE